MGAHEVRDVPERSHYELVEDDREIVGTADYVIEADRMVIPHTEIVPPRRGQGLGALLVRGVLDDARRRGLRVVPACGYVAGFIDANPEYADLLAA